MGKLSLAQSHVRPVDPLSPESIGALHDATEDAGMTLRGLSTLVLAFELASHPWTSEDRSDVAAIVGLTLRTVAQRLDAARAVAG